MTSTMLDSRPVLSKYDNRPMPVLFDRPYEANDDIGLTRVPPATCWDQDIDRWINEGGAIRKCPQVLNDRGSRK